MVVGHKSLYILLTECGRLRYSALHLSGHRRRQIASCPGTSLGV